MATALCNTKLYILASYPSTTAFVPIEISSASEAEGDTDSTKKGTKRGKEDICKHTFMLTLIAVYFFKMNRN